MKSSWLTLSRRNRDLFNPDAHTPASPYGKIQGSARPALASLSRRVPSPASRSSCAGLRRIKGYFPTYAGLDEAEGMAAPAHPRPSSNIYIAEPHASSNRQQEAGEAHHLAAGPACCFKENDALCDVFEGALLNLDAKSVARPRKPAQERDFREHRCEHRNTAATGFSWEQLRHVMNS